jgi:hypothetical protein
MPDSCDHPEEASKRAAGAKPSGHGGKECLATGGVWVQLLPAVLFVLAVDAGCATQAVQGNVPPSPVSPSPQLGQSEPEVWCASDKLPPVEVFSGVGGSLSSLSERFREAHQRARAKQCTVLATQQLMIRYSFGMLEARWKGVELGRPANLYTPRVHALKAVSHAVFLAALLFEEPSRTAIRAGRPQC